MIRRLVLLGATGDLAGRFLLPALAALHAAGRLPPDFRLVGAATEDWDDEAFRRHATRRLEQHGAGLPAAAREAVVRSLSYRRIDFDDPRTVTQVVASTGEAGAATEPLVAYLALPTRVFTPAVTSLGAAGLPPGSRIVLEKPFGEDLEEAMALNRLLAQVVGAAGEQAVFRVDHVLGMATVRNLLGLRLANRVLEAVWNSAHIEQVDILWEETLALEGRSGFYDHAGALKDVLQNHIRPLPHSPFGEAATPTSNELHIGVDGPEAVTLRLTGGTAETPTRPLPLSLTAPPPPAELPAYGPVLLDILSGGSTLSIRGDEAELAWRVLTPVLHEWAQGRVPMQEYPAGSDGPSRDG